MGFECKCHLFDAKSYYIVCGSLFTAKNVNKKLELVGITNITDI